MYKILKNKISAKPQAKAIIEFAIVTIEIITLSKCNLLLVI